MLRGTRPTPPFRRLARACARGRFARAQPPRFPRGERSTGPFALSRSNPPQGGKVKDLWLRLSCVLVASVLATGGAEAEPQWREYAYADQQFAVSFPAEPTVATVALNAPDGGNVSEKI